MKAFISGQAERAILVRGVHLAVYDAEKFEERRYALSELKYLIDGATDVEVLDVKNAEEARQPLELSYRRDRAFRMTAILLDADEDPEIRQEAASVLDEFIAEPVVRNWVVNWLYATPIANPVAFAAALRASEGIPAVHQLLGEIEIAQNSIQQWRDAWNALPGELFRSDRDRNHFESRAIQSGAFRALATTSADRANATLFELHNSLRREPNARDVIGAWTTMLPRMRQNAEPLLFEDDEETYARDEASPASGPSHITFSKVMRQQAAIVQQLGRGDVATAARFVDQLITLQTDNGGPEFAAKSLCSLAQSAKALGNDELHYEWSTRAAEINPSDTRATGQAADACIRMEHFDEALRLLSLTETYGDPLFARLGRARILRAQGNLDGALAAFQTLEKEFAGNAEVSYAWAGHAEVLREMWCLDEALATYRLGSELDQEALFLKCGVGAVLTDMGLLAEAEKVYASVLAHDGERHVAQNGKATVLREMGDLPAALVEFERCIEKFPGNVVAYCGRADVLRLSGKISEALEAYQEAAKRFPFEATPYLGSADILRENGQLDEALQVYEAGIARFPRKPRMFIGRAYVLKYQHKTEASLQAFDKVTQKFPYELGGLLGRADLLKEMGKLDEALEFYDKVIDRWSMHPYARNAKASILAVGKRYAEAEALLTTGIPQTEADWSAVHLRGMILLRKGEIQKALDHFTKAMLQTPYARHRKLFAKSCAVARLRLQQYVEAETSVRDPQEPVADVIAMHVMAATGQSEPAIRQLIKIRKNAFAPVIGIAEEIASQYRLHSVPARHDFDWIYDREIEALMLQAAFLPVGGQGRFLHN